MLHMLHGWSDGDETTGQPQHRSTRQHHSAIDQPSSAPVNVVRGQHLPPSTRPPSPSSTPLLLRPLPSSTRSSSTPLVSLDYRSQHHQDYSLGLPILQLHHLGLILLRRIILVRGRLTIITLYATGPHRL